MDQDETQVFLCFRQHQKLSLRDPGMFAENIPPRSCQQPDSDNSRAAGGPGTLRLWSISGEELESDGGTGPGLIYAINIVADLEDVHRGMRQLMVYSVNPVSRVRNVQSV